MLSTDIKLYYSENTTEDDQGGGAMSLIEVPDNTVENVFKRITRLERVQGDVQAQQLYMCNRAPGNEQLKDSLVYLDNQPADPKTYVSLVEAPQERRVDLMDKLFPGDVEADAELLDSVRRPLIATAAVGDTVIYVSITASSYNDFPPNLYKVQPGSLIALIPGHRPYAVQELKNEFTDQVAVYIDPGLSKAVAAGTIIRVVPAKGLAGIGMRVVGNTELSGGASAGGTSVFIRDVSARLQPSMSSRVTSQGIFYGNTSGEPGVQDVVLDTMTYWAYRTTVNDAECNAFWNIFDGNDGNLCQSDDSFFEFTAPVKSGSFQILFKDKTSSTPNIDGHFKSEVCPENTYYRAVDRSSTVLVSGADYDVIYVYLPTTGYWPVSLLHRASGRLHALAVSDTDAATVPLQHLGITTLESLYGSDSTLYKDINASPDKVYFSAQTVIGSGYRITENQLLPNNGAINSYSTDLPAGTLLPTLRVQYLRRNPGFSYESVSGSITETLTKTALLYGPDWGDIGTFSSELNIYPNEQSLLDSTAYADGFLSSATVNNSFFGTGYTLSLNLGDDPCDGDVIVSYDVLHDASYTPDSYTYIVPMSVDGVVEPESLSMFTRTTYDFNGEMRALSLSCDAAGVISGDGSGVYSPENGFAQIETTRPVWDLYWKVDSIVESTKNGGKSTVQQFFADDVIIVKEGATEELAVVDKVDIASRYVYLKTPLLNSYSAGALVAGVLELGDLYARVSELSFFQTWDEADWLGTGAPNSGNFNDLDHPIIVANEGCVDEDWVIEFTSSTEFNVRGRRRGIVGTGNVSADTAIDSGTGLPYFTLPAAGFSGTWQFGEGFAFRTFGNAGRFWVVRGVQYGSSWAQQDSVRVVYGGDV
jgi:hypothetical protein